MSKKPIRVLQYIGCLEMGGSQSMIMNIYRNIDRTKIQFDFIVDKKVKSPYIEEIKSLGGKIYSFKYHFNGLNYMPYTKQWKVFFNEHTEYKIIHSHVRSTASIVFKIAKKYGLKTICHSHNTSNGSGIKSIAKKYLQDKIKKYCDYYFACSQGSAQWLYGRKIAVSDKCIIINNAIDTDKYRYNEATREAIRKKLELNDKIVIGQVGRLEKVKNYYFSINLLKRLKDKNKNYHLLIIGTGPQKDELLNYARENNVLGNITLLENRTDVNSLMQGMDAFIMPSLYEGLPLSLVEAQAASLPCIVSNNVNAGIFDKSAVKKISLKNEDDWINEIERSIIESSRKDSSEIIVKSGFDIKEVANNISSIYHRINENIPNKILFCLGSLRKGGAERVVANISNYLIKQSEILIVTTIRTNPAYRLDKRIKLLSLDDSDKRRSLPIRTIRRTYSLRKILKTEKPDIAIAFLPEPSYRLMIAKSNLKTPSIISVRNDPNREYNSVIKKLLVKCLYAKANGFVFQTKDAQKWFSKTIEEKSTIIPNPIDNNFLRSPYRGVRKKIIVTAGRLVDQKNHILLIDAFAIFHKKHNDYRLRIYGDGPLKNQLRSHILSLGMMDCIELMGNKDNLYDEIYTAKAFILTSNYEGMPNSLMEALAIGVPCISTDCPIGGPKSLIINRKNGLLVRTNNIAELASAMEEIVNNEKMAKTFSLSSSEKCKQFSIDKICNQWVTFIKTVIDRANNAYKR